MLITIHDDANMSLSHFEQPGFELEAEPDVEARFDAMQMFGASLGLCTASVLATYGEQLEAGMQNLSVRVDWKYQEDPYRISFIELEVTWPSVPDSRIEAAQRAAETCTLHNTLHSNPTIETRVQKG